MHNSESFSSLTVEVGGPAWDLPTQDDGIPLDSYHSSSSSPSPSLSSSSVASIPSSFPPSNNPSPYAHHTPSRLEVPLSIPQLFKKYGKGCIQVIMVDTFIGMICFLVAAPYMIWATYGGNYATLIQGVKEVPSWMDYLERTDTLIIGVCFHSIFVYYYYFIHFKFFHLSSQLTAPFLFVSLKWPFWLLLINFLCFFILLQAFGALMTSILLIFLFDDPSVKKSF